MLQHQPLFQAILADPRDDEVRLVYADWLEEHGALDQAEFIRGQFRLARLRSWDEGYTALDVRCRELARAHPEWLRGLDEFVEQGTSFFEWDQTPFDRGFPARVKATPEEFEAHPEWFETAPLQGASFHSSAPVGRRRARYANLPGLEQLSEVSFLALDDSTRGDQEVVRCVRRLGLLDHFGMAGGQLLERTAPAALSADAVVNARSLRLVGALTPAAERQLIEARLPNLRRFERLVFPNLDWLRADWARQLEELSIGDRNNLAPGTLELLAEVLPEMGLTTLRLDEWLLHEAVARLLGRAISRAGVKSLTLSHNRSPAVVSSLFDRGTSSDLHELFITWAGFDEAFVRLLKETSPGTSLRVCGLDHVTLAGLRALATPPGLPAVESLRLGLVWATREIDLRAALREFLRADTLPSLVSLTLCDTRPYSGRVTGLGDKVAALLAGCTEASRLQELRLDMGQTTVKGAVALAESPHLDGLRLLDVPTHPDDQKARDILTARFGHRVGFYPGGRSY